MIARIWRGWAPKPTADDYQRHYESEVAEHLTGVEGFQGARLLRVDDRDEVMFTSITFWASLKAVRGFAGDEYDRAVVEEDARRALSHWEEHVQHQEVAVDLSIDGSPRSPSPCHHVRYAGKRSSSFPIPERT